MKEKFYKRKTDSRAERFKGWLGLTTWTLFVSGILCTIFLFTNFSTKNYTDAGDEKIRYEHRKDIQLQELKLEFIANNIGKNEKEIERARQELKEMEKNLKKGGW